MQRSMSWNSVPSMRAAAVVEQHDVILARARRDRRAGAARSRSSCRTRIPAPSPSAPAGAAASPHPPASARSFRGWPSTIWTRGRVCVRSPLPSLVTMMLEPVSAMRKLAPVMPTSAARNFWRAPEISYRRCRHHRRQFPHRRDRLDDHRHQRRQWRPDADPAKAHIVAREPREGRADAGRCLHHPAPARALGDGPGILDIHHRLDRPAPARPTRDGPGEFHVVLLDNGRSAMLGTRVPGHAALYPLRRLHEPLPGLCRGRRPRLWLGLSRADGRGADARA